jgi:hypothetical protein
LRKSDDGSENQGGDFKFGSQELKKEEYPSPDFS